MALPMAAGIWLLVAASMAQVTIPRLPVGTAPPLPPGKPQPPPAYMKDNINNYWGTAPDKGSLTGPVLGPLNATELEDIHPPTHQTPHLIKRQNTDDYWLSTLGSSGKMPFAPDGYQFYRNVKDFGAVGDGVTDDTAAINRAAATYGLDNTSELRCGESCGSSTTLGAVVYFPPGTYLISTPIIQYYYTQFVGNPNSKPIIKSTFNFTGIAMFDSDFYIPGGNSDEWYINQSNFYRQIRNFVFDMTGQNWTNTDNDQPYVPTGIHWQVGQATSITNCDFKMAVSNGSQSATAVGIHMENGSGGVVSDLTFFGGSIGFVAGSQQFTANNLQFTSCLTAIYHIFNWGFNWRNIYVLSCYIAFDCTSYSGITHQGTGSITVQDSHFNGVPYAITVARMFDEQPNVVLDNLLVENSESVVLVSGGETILAGSSGPQYFNSWASGYQYLPNGNGVGGKRSGFIDPAPSKPAALLANGAFFQQPKPQYAGSTPISATDHGISNDGSGDQTNAINSFLSSNVGSVLFFPGGIYLVQGTVQIPVGSQIIGSGWSQIMGTGSFFEDADNPQVMVRVGNPGESGMAQISDFLFTVKGATAGCILMEWNVHESSQGSAAMWDSHFRVGGATGSNLQIADCPVGGSSINSNCMAASMLLHVTSKASGYFDNVWAWVADHDLDDPANADATESPEGIPLNVKTDISIYSGRGILIESQGPTWFYGSSAEHSQLYQYELLNASTIYMGHMQTETPYYQPNPNALKPYTPGEGGFQGDPMFENCADDLCKGAWALRVVNSSDIFIYSAGFYSFFQNNGLGCAPNENCQLALIDTNFASGLWIYNIFTKGNVQIVSPQGGLAPLLFNSTTSDGYTSEIAAWLALSTGGEDIGDSPGGGSGLVTIDPDVWTSAGTASASVQCIPPCTYVLPPLTLPTETTFSFPLLSTSLTVGYYSTITFTYAGNLTSTVSYITSIESTIITIPAVTTSVISWFEIPVTVNSTILYPVPSVTQTPFNITDPLTIGNFTTSSTHNRTFYPPPWPGSTVPPSLTRTPTPGQTSTPPGASRTSGDNSVHHTSGGVRPTCTHASGCGHSCGSSDSCSSCWTDCSGPPSLNGPDPNQPGGRGDPDDDNSSECETATYSSCNTFCVTASPTSSCSSTCSEVVGCDTTGTDVSSIYTLPSAYVAPNENWISFMDNNTISDWLVGQSIWSKYGSSSDVTITSGPPQTSNPPISTTPTSTSNNPTASVPTNYPTNTAENVGGALCYTQDNSPYVSFTVDDAMNVISAFCASNYTLSPGQANAYVEEYMAAGGYSVVVSAGWAPDQSGCGSERDFAFSQQPDNCLEGWSTDFYCENEDGDQDSSYGGAYVLEPPDQRGCILLELYAFNPPRKRMVEAMELLLFERDGEKSPLKHNVTDGRNINATALVQLGSRNGTKTSIWGTSTKAEVSNEALFNSTLLQKILRGNVTFPIGSPRSELGGSKTGGN